jgi:hypothetical protein
MGDYDRSCDGIRKCVCPLQYAHLQFVQYLYFFIAFECSNTIVWVSNRETPGSGNITANDPWVLSVFPNAVCTFQQPSVCDGDPVYSADECCATTVFLL